MIRENLAFENNMEGRVSLSVLSTFYIINEKRNLNLRIILSYLPNANA